MRESIELPVKRIIIPPKENLYSSFPTFSQYQNKIYIYYRQGIKNSKQCHGIGGKVKCFEIDKEMFLKSFDDRKTKTLYGLGENYVVFKGGNEFDAIVSKLDAKTFSLATRTYIKNRMKTYISVSDKPVFKDRFEIKIKGIEWLAFYGKGFKWREGYAFPAYGQLTSEECERPLVIATNDLLHFELLSYLPSDINGPILNESSIVFDGRKYYMFMREETYPMGIWSSASEDLQNWETPERFLSFAHAPMALFHKNKFYLAFRDLISLVYTSSMHKSVIDEYSGNPYDGGYSDIEVIDGKIFMVYYTGNKKGEPFIKCCRL